MTMIEQHVSFLIEQQTSSTITTTTSSGDTSDPVAHLKAVRAECQKVSSNIINPIARFGFERMIESAFSQLRTDSIGWNKESDQNYAATSFENTPCGRRVSTMKSRQSRSTTTLKNSHQIASLFGTLSFSTTTTWDQDDDEDLETSEAASEVKTQLTFHPSWWLITCGLHYGLQFEFEKSFQGPECRMKTYCAVPDDAAIFKYCKSGNIAGIRKLFDEKRASPWDTNSRGMTPLMAS